MPPSACVWKTAYHSQHRGGCCGVRASADVQDAVSRPPRPQVGTALRLLGVMKDAHGVLYLCSKRHHFRFLSCISRGTAQDAHPSPPAAERVLALGLLCPGRRAQCPPHPTPPTSCCMALRCIPLQLLCLPGLSVSCLPWDPSFRVS